MAETLPYKLTNICNLFPKNSRILHKTLMINIVFYDRVISRAVSHATVECACPKSLVLELGLMYLVTCRKLPLFHSWNTVSYDRGQQQMDVLTHTYIINLHELTWASLSEGQFYLTILYPMCHIEISLQPFKTILLGLLFAVGSLKWTFHWNYQDSSSLSWYCVDSCDS